MLSLMTVEAMQSKSVDRLSSNFDLNCTSDFLAPSQAKALDLPMCSNVMLLVHILWNQSRDTIACSKNGDLWMTDSFKVYKLVFNDKEKSIAQQVEVKSIGDEAMFVGDPLLNKMPFKDTVLVSLIYLSTQNKTKNCILSEDI
ncbi:hypothetical protein ACFX1R_028037 [Malus domestica]